MLQGMPADPSGPQRTPAVPNDQQNHHLTMSATRKSEPAQKPDRRAGRRETQAEAIERARSISGGSITVQTSGSVIIVGEDKVEVGIRTHTMGKVIGEVVGSVLRIAQESGTLIRLTDAGTSGLPVLRPEELCDSEDAAFINSFFKKKSSAKR